MTVTLITGGNKGLGFATARRLVAAGHSVYIGSRNAERGRSAAEALGAKFLQLDVTDDSLVRRALAEVDEKEGRLDILINNAGIGDGPGIDRITSVLVTLVAALWATKITAREAHKDSADTLKEQRAQLDDTLKEQHARQHVERRGEG
jgi:NAD(P)-dependent dehydrogenase (short-subunit alcohol dehydrogenase family)